ncbi:MAG: Gfo/Idh/MocA family protein [Phycisphaerales bacterium JB063]
MTQQNTPSQAETGTTSTHAPIRWLVVGTGIIAGDFARGLRGVSHGRVACVVGSRPGRAEDFAAKWALDEIECTDAIEQALSGDSVDAVYIATPHPSHEAMALASIRAGKATLVEKPIAMDWASASRIVNAAREQGTFLMEAYMYRCHPLITRLIALLKEGAIGQIQRIESRLCFEAPFDPGNRLFNPTLGGGAILDVGGYPLSMAGLVAGCAEGIPYAHPKTINASGVLGQTGVEEDARAELVYDSGVVANLRCSIREEAGNATRIVGDAGSLVLPNAWLPDGDRHGRVSTIILKRDGHPKEEIETVAPAAVYALEAELVAEALAEGDTLEPIYPALNLAGTLSNMQLLDAWRELVADGGGKRTLDLS